MTLVLNHIPRSKRRVLNWAECAAALCERSSLTVWVSEEGNRTFETVPRTTPGGQPAYSDFAITTAPRLRTMFGLAVRQIVAACLTDRDIEDAAQIGPLLDQVP